MGTLRDLEELLRMELERRVRSDTLRREMKTEELLRVIGELKRLSAGPDTLDATDLTDAELIQECKRFGLDPARIVDAYYGERVGDEEPAPSVPPAGADAADGASGPV